MSRSKAWWVVGGALGALMLACVVFSVFIPTAYSARTKIFYGMQKPVVHQTLDRGPADSGLTGILGGNSSPVDRGSVEYYNYFGSFLAVYYDYTGSVVGASAQAGNWPERPRPTVKVAGPEERLENQSQIDRRFRTDPNSANR